MTAGTILFIISLVIMGVGDIFRSNKALLANAFLYGVGLFLVSVITIFVGVLLGARSGKLQNRANEIWNNKKN